MHFFLKSNFKSIFFLLPLVLPAMILLGGCQHYQVTQEVDAAQQADPDLQNPFLKELHSLYASFADKELKQEQDYPDAIRFARKARDAGDGINVFPTELADWVLTQNMMPELQMARIRLTQLFFLESQTEYPVKTARAQALYDCWVEEQEEAGEISAQTVCKENFYRVIKELEGDLLDRPAKTVAKPALKKPDPLNKKQARTDQNVNTVFFEFDKSTLGKEAKKRIANIAGQIKKQDVKRVTVRGHADTVGTPGYNNTLSLNRALTVREELINNGLPESKVFIDWKGERKNMQDMGDEERTRLNRRVDILF